MGGRSWTEREDAVIRGYASLGVRKVVNQLREECRSQRTEQAVQCRASRLGVSLFKHGTCPWCGRWTRRLDPMTGLCAICAARKARDANYGRLALVERTKLTKEDDDALSKARRDSGRIRKAIYDARK